VVWTVEAENKEHFLLLCAALTEIHTNFIDQIYILLDSTEVTFTTGEDLLQILLDSTEWGDLIHDLECIHQQGIMFQMSQRRVNTLAVLEPILCQGRGAKKIPARHAQLCFYE
jgi:hypothetical protein